MNSFYSTRSWATKKFEVKKHKTKSAFLQIENTFSPAHRLLSSEKRFLLWISLSSWDLQAFCVTNDSRRKPEKLQLNK